MLHRENVFSHRRRSWYWPGSGQGTCKVWRKIYALSRTKETLDSLVKYSDRIYPIVTDVSDWDHTRSIVDKLDTLDGVVNNAAYHPGTGLTAALDCPRERFEIAFSTNTLAAINIIQTAGKKMVQRGNGGSIVNVSRYVLSKTAPTVVAINSNFIDL